MSCAHTTWAKEPYSKNQWQTALAVALKLATLVADLDRSGDHDMFLFEGGKWVASLFAHANVEARITTDSSSGLCITGVVKDVKIIVMVNLNPGPYIRIYHEDKGCRGGFSFGNQIDQTAQQTMPVENILELIANISTALCRVPPAIKL